MAQETISKTNNGDKLGYLQLIQEPICRMSTISAIFKGFAATIVAGIAMISYEEVNVFVLGLSFLPLLVFFALDIYYLKLERKFRLLYSAFNNASLKNSFFANCRMHLTDFIYTDLRYAYIVCTSLSQSNFSYSNMTMSKIHYVDFCNANLSNALLNMSKLNHVLFASSNLQYLNLSGATIKNCAFKDCRFESVNLSGSIFENCVFENVKFVNNIGIHSCKFINCYTYNCRKSDDNELKSIDELKIKFN